jgi:hypothetical protein
LSGGLRGVECGESCTLRSKWIHPEVLGALLDGQDLKRMEASTLHFAIREGDNVTELSQISH